MRLLTFLITFVILVAVSFVMLWLGDKLDASGMAITRFLASGQAPVSAQLGYPAVGREQIAVFLYDQEFLQENTSAWPLTYQDHADWLLPLAGLPGARPKAIFLDITFGQARQDASLPVLKQALCTLQNDFGVPVFIAALPSPEDGKLTSRLGPGGAESCFTLVGVDYTPDPVDRMAWNYPLTRHYSPAGWTDGPGSAAPVPAPPYRSAALVLAQEVAKMDLGAETLPMALVWGHDAAAGAAVTRDFSGCVATRSLASNMTPGVFRQVTEPDRPRLCPYHSAMSMDRTKQISEQELAAHIKDRYLMIGARIPGHNDFVTSPVHEVLPGVFYHAMALDNLLTYGKNYKLNHEWDFDGFPILIGPALLTIGVVLLAHWLFAWAAEFCASRLSTAATEADSPAHGPLRRRALHVMSAMRSALDAAAAGQTFQQRVASTLIDTLAWATRILLQFAAAIVMIAWLQEHSRVGMLPVVELVGMSLLAEGISYIGKLRWFFLGKQTACPQSA